MFPDGASSVICICRMLFGVQHMFHSYTERIFVKWLSNHIAQARDCHMPFTIQFIYHTIHPRKVYNLMAFILSQSRAAVILSYTFVKNFNPVFNLHFMFLICNNTLF